MKINNGLFKVVCEVGEAFDMKNEDLTLTFREPTYEEQTELIKGSNTEGSQVIFWKKNFASLLTEYEGFVDDDGNEYKKTEIVNEIKKRGTLYSNLMSTYLIALSEKINPEKKRVSEGIHKEED